jgi:hypothetical protein
MKAVNGSPRNDIDSLWLYFTSKRSEWEKSERQVGLVYTMRDVNGSQRNDIQLNLLSIGEVGEIGLIYTLRDVNGSQHNDILLLRLNLLTSKSDRSDRSILRKLLTVRNAMI